MPFTLMSFSKSIDRKDFCCGTPELDKYFVEQLGQDEGRDATRA